MTQDAGGTWQQGGVPQGAAPQYGAPQQSGTTGQGAAGQAWPGYRPGTSIPVDAQFQQDLQQRLQSQQAGERATAERDAFITQTFTAWQVYPVKVGRWRLKLYGLVEPDAGWGDDPISAVLFVFYLVYLAFWFIGWALLGLGKWVGVPNVVQVLDPATGRPIAEHLIAMREGGPRAALELPVNGTLAFLGDPRVCGLVGQPTPQGTVQVRGTAFRRGPGWKVKFKDFTPQALAANAQQLAASPYQEFPNGRTGQWMVDSAHAPSGGRTRWTRLASRPKR